MRTPNDSAKLLPRARPRVCIVIPNHWSVTKGGAEYQADLITHYLWENTSSEIYLISQQILLDKPLPTGDAISIRPRRIGSGQNPVFDVLALWRALKKVQPDVIYQRVGCAYTGVCAAYALWSKCRFIWHVAHDYEAMPKRLIASRRTFLKVIDKKLLEFGVKRANVIIAQTNDQANLIAQHYGSIETVVIRNAHPFPSKTTFDKKRRVLWIANIKRFKRPCLFIRLAQSLCDLEGVEFVMIGRPSGELAWQGELYREIKKTRNLKYLGECDQQRVNQFLEESMLLVNTSLREGFSNTFIQAWMRRVPTITVGVNPDKVFDSMEVGVCTQTEAELARVVRDLLINEDRMLRLGENARIFALQNHGTANFAKIAEVILKD